MHQADGLEEAAILGCGLLGQVRFQKRTENCESRTPADPPHNPSKPRPTGAGGEKQGPRVLGPDGCHHATTEHTLSPMMNVRTLRQTLSQELGPARLPLKMKKTTKERQESKEVFAK